MMMKSTLFFLIGLGASTSTIVRAEKTKDKEVILVGGVHSMTGPEATFGVSTVNGVNLALKKINAAGGVNGRLIQFKNLDNQGKPEESASAIKRLINYDKVIAVIGEVASSNSLAMAPIAQSSKIPMISPSSTNERVTAEGDYIFRVCFIDPFQGTVMAKFALETLKIKKVAVLRDTTSDYSKGLAKHFKEYFIKHGGTITTGTEEKDDQTYSKGNIEFKPQLTTIRSQKPEAIFVPGYYTDVGLIARQARELGIKVPLLGGDGWDSEKLTEIAQKAIDGSFYSNHYSADDKAENVQKFISDYKAEYKKTPDGLAALGYDAMVLLVDTMKKTKEVTSKNIRDELAKTKDFKGVTGNITMDANRNPVKSAVVVELVKGEHHFKQTINP